MHSHRVRARPFLVLVALCAAFLLPVAARAQWPPESFENLQVLPKDIALQELFQTMSGFTRALGVRCSYCHVGDEGASLDEYDFVSDDKATKRTARQMLRMVGRINDTFLEDLDTRRAPGVTVQCATCHRGVSRPRMIEDILGEAYDSYGIDSTVTTYRRLRERYYGRFAYDFGEVPLVTTAAQIAERDATDDALRLLELNVEMNPDSPFARTQLMTFALNDAFTRGGVDAGRQAYAGFRVRFDTTEIPERLLNSVGYSLLRRKLVDAAVAAFQLNVEAYPQSGNVYDSLGEGLAAKGDVPGAIAAYERSLEIDPSNRNAVEKLRELRAR